MEVKLSIKCLVDGEEQELKFGVEGDNLVLIKDEPQQSDNDQAEDVGQSEEKENVPVAPPQPVVVKDSMQIVKQKETEFTAQANTLYSFEEEIDSLTVKLAKPTDENKTAEYAFAFVTAKDFKFKEFDTEDGYPVFYPTDFVLNNSTMYVLTVLYVGGGYVVNEIPYL